MRLTFFIVSIVAVVAAAVGGLLTWYRRHRDRSNRITDDIDRLVASGRYEEATLIATTALGVSTEPEECFDLRIRLARTLAAAERYDEAADACREATLHAPASHPVGDAGIESARILALEGKFDEASAMLAGLSADRCSADGRVRRQLALADIALSRLRFAEAEAALAAAFDPAQSEILADEAALSHARLQYLRGNFRQAIAETTRLLDRMKNEDALAMALLIRARALIDQERPDPVSAEADLAKALILAHYPGYAAVVRACYGLVQAHFKNEREALETAVTAPELCVSARFAVEAHCLVGDTMRQLGKYAEARSHYQQALGLDAASLEALWGLATCAQMTGLYQVAEPYFRLCIEAAPEHYLGRRSEEAIEG